MFIDAHTHRPSQTTHIRVNVHTKAIHPWDLALDFKRDNFLSDWEKLKLETSAICAIGECGLDRVHEGIAPIKDQLFVLEKHFELARELNLPIILHIVRAYSDLLHMLKQKRFSNNILLHAFGGNEHEMNELLKYPVYFSYGKRLFNTDKMLKQTPIDKLLLETGDQSEYTIEEIYNKAAFSLGVKLADLELQLEQNFLTFFGKKDDVSAAHFIKYLNSSKTLN